MSMVDELRMGIYRHYKGPLYQVESLAHDANHKDRTCVVYFGLELNGAHLGPRKAVRTLDDFAAHICTRQDCLHYGSRHWEVCAYVGRGHLDCEADGHVSPRFEYLGPVLTEEMLKSD